MDSRLLSFISNRYILTSLFLATTGLAATTILSNIKPLDVTPDQFAPTILREKEYITNDLARFRFELPNNVQSYLNSTPYPVYYTFANDELNVVRHYTPVAWDPKKKFLDFLIQRIPQGETSNYLHRLGLNFQLRMKGPFSQWNVPSAYKHMGLIAGDSGITVFAQIVPRLLEQGKFINLLFYSTTDFHLLKEDLEALKIKYPNQLVTTYLFKEPTKDDVKKYLPPPDENSLIMLCCPKPLMGIMAGYKDESSLEAQGEFSGLLKEMNYKQEDVHKF
ncbi:NADH-cytochrome b5 reductase [Coelomomyces lativittatus]|nr:NADH-cytochrome b5 reductase [Coelomomyces lativittatus]KAJ1500407.1 NADH-cytochrome b5 reductase [Coelomomyces lativittatus]